MESLITKIDQQDSIKTQLFLDSITNILDLYFKILKKGNIKDEDFKKYNYEEHNQQITKVLEGGGRLTQAALITFSKTKLSKVIKRSLLYQNTKVNKELQAYNMKWYLIEPTEEITQATEITNIYQFLKSPKVDKILKTITITPDLPDKLFKLLKPFIDKFGSIIDIENYGIQKIKNKLGSLLETLGPFLDNFLQLYNQSKNNISFEILFKVINSFLKCFMEINDIATTSIELNELLQKFFGIEYPKDTDSKVTDSKVTDTKDKLDQNVDDKYNQINNIFKLTFNSLSTKIINKRSKLITDKLKEYG